MSDKEILGKECRFAVYVPPPEILGPNAPDMHFVKELTYYKDGTTEPTTNIIYNYKRPFWVAHKGVRNYNQPKEWLPKDQVYEVKTTQSQLIETAARSLGSPWFKGNQRKLQENPYLFGTDIKSTAVIKNAYKTKYSKIETSLFSIMFLDIETNVLNDVGDILMLTIYFQGHCITFLSKEFVKGLHDVENRIDVLMRKYLGEYVDKYKIQSRTVMCDDEMDILKKAFAEIHKFKPDLLSIWNMDFEITEFIKVCQRNGVSMQDIISDPSVPKEYRYFDYKRGESQKVTASGKITPIPPASRWHTVYAPASFYIIDAMCAFKHTRIGNPERSSYSLDNILSEELELGKLKFKEADKYTKLKWHVFMQENYKLEYVIYNRFDCIGMFLLEEKNKDQTLFIPLYSGTSDFEDFKSQPRRIVDQLHWFALENDKVIGTTSKALTDEYASQVYGMDGWISNLAAPLITQQGLKIIEEAPELETTIYVAVGDLDVAASYPHGGLCYNISKETTVKELVNIEGIPEEVYRIQNMQLTSGHVDAVEWCTNMLGFPKLTDISKAWDSNANL